MIEQFRRWFDYEVRAHERVMESLEGVPEQERGRPEFAKAVDVFAHVIAARRLWLSRFGVIDAPEELFPSGVALENIRPMHEGAYALWKEWMLNASEEDLGVEFTYAAIDGNRFTSTVEEILTQLFGHSWYHRGQIASLVKACGGEPAVTDFIYLTRRPAEG